jgi:cytochrome b6-f complex iron-sulfur subunit
MKLLSLAAVLTAAGTAAAFAPVSMGARKVVATNMAAAEEFYIDEDRRYMMNLILLGSATVTVGAFGIPYIAFFLPPSSGDASAGVSAKDALGNDIFAKPYLESHPAGDHNLAQGLKGDAT